MEKLEFFLYIAGDNKISKEAIYSLNKFCTEEIHSNYTVTIIDILKDSYSKETSKIFGIPTLIMKNSEKEIRVIGDLSGKEKLLQILNLEKNYG